MCATVRGRLVLTLAIARQTELGPCDQLMTPTVTQT